jgi:hypothetical protein
MVKIQITKLSETPGFWGPWAQFKKPPNTKSSHNATVGGLFEMKLRLRKSKCDVLKISRKKIIPLFTVCDRSGAPLCRVALSANFIPS